MPTVTPEEIRQIFNGPRVEPTVLPNYGDSAEKLLLDTYSYRLLAQVAMSEMAVMCCELRRHEERYNQLRDEYRDFRKRMMAKGR